jgi:hypothetical protein
MPEYKLIVNEDGAIILDQGAMAVDTETALSLLDLLHQRYERLACVYVVRNVAMGAYKIGWTAQRIEARVSQIRYDVGDWQGVDIDVTIPCPSTSEARQLEAELHTQFAGKRLYGEWFNLSVEDLIFMRDMAYPGLRVACEKVNRLLFGVDQLEDVAKENRKEAAQRAQWLSDFYAAAAKELKG